MIVPEDAVFVPVAVAVPVPAVVPLVVPPVVPVPVLAPVELPPVAAVLPEHEQETMQFAASLVLRVVVPAGHPQRGAGGQGQAI